MKINNFSYNISNYVSNAPNSISTPIVFKLTVEGIIYPPQIEELQYESLISIKELRHVPDIIKILEESPNRILARDYTDKIYIFGLKFQLCSHSFLGECMWCKETNASCEKCGYIKKDYKSNERA